jgi:transketolase
MIVRLESEVHRDNRPSVLSSRSLRRLILEESRRANVGHIGSALSIVDIIVALYTRVLRADPPDDPNRDRFVLAKGHAALSVYAALHLLGRLDRAELATYCANDSLLGVHPSHALAGIDFSTGSLGQGLSFGIGAALAARLQRSDRRVFVLISDAECNEGSTWEAAMFAGHHQLDGLVAIIDFNGQQALGHCADVLDQSNCAQRWRAFGWQVREIDGHDPAAIAAALSRNGEARPLAVVAHTVSGRGVSFMQGEVRWHYMPMSDSEYRQALAESDALP